MALLVFLRLPLLLTFCGSVAKNLFYGPAYTLPILVLTHFILGGVICTFLFLLLLLLHLLVCALTQSLFISLSNSFFSLSLSLSPLDYSFPYLLAVACICFNVFPLANLEWRVVKRKGEVFFFFVRYFLLSYSVVSMWYANSAHPDKIALGLVTVFSPAVPLLLYLVTSKYTAPEYFCDY